MSTPEKQFTIEQLKLLEKARTIVRNAKEIWAKECDAHGLKTLARKYDWLANQLDIAISNQQRTLKLSDWKDETKPAEPETEAPKDETPSEGKGLS